MDTLTDRQFIALYLYYIEGQSYRKIAGVFGIATMTAHEHVRNARNKLIRIRIDNPYPYTSPLVERLIEPSPTSSVTRGAGIAASRREELLDALERRMAQRDAELADITECMAGDSFSPTHTKGNTFDQWEVRYLMRHDGNGGEGLPTGAYRGDHAAANCACDDDLCPLACCNCRYALHK